MNRTTIKKVCTSYFNFLKSIDWNDEIYLAGIKEGKNKFLSNAILSLNKGNKYLKGDYYSPGAKEKIDKGDFTELIYEHMVPKSKYIQKPCEELAKSGDLDLDFVINIVQKYWKIAIITKAEDELLRRTSMPQDWDEIDIFLRYNEVGLELDENI